MQVKHSSLSTVAAPRSIFLNCSGATALAAVAALGVGAAPVAVAAKPAAAVAADVPQVTASAKIAPIPASLGTPFGSTAINLRDYGYIEEEFYASGNANRYRIKNPQATAQVVDGANPYTTRILVRRPTDPKKFNGKVLLEWFNVSTHEDVDVTFAAMRRHLLDEGYVWVGISAQIQGINALRNWNPDRYGKLSLTADNVDPQGGTLEQLSAFFPNADLLSWDAFTQVGNALRHPAGVDPLGGLKPNQIFAVGESQSAARLSTYYNSILPHARATFDGFLLYDGVQFPMRTDLGTKMLSFASESSRSFGPGPEDSNVLRVWEVAGTSHVSYDETINYLEEQYQRMGVVRGFDGYPYKMQDTFVGCDIQPIYSRVPNGDVLNAGIEALAQWASTGKAPPVAERLHREGNGKIHREGEGRVVGGVRLAAYDAPMAKNMGRNTGGGVACGLAGSHLDYTPAQMRQLYDTPEAYVAKVTAVTQKALQDGFLVKADADRTIMEAKAIKF